MPGEGAGGVATATRLWWRWGTHRVARTGGIEDLENLRVADGLRERRGGPCCGARLLCKIVRGKNVIRQCVCGSIEVGVQRSELVAHITEDVVDAHGELHSAARSRASRDDARVEVGNIVRQRRKFPLQLRRYAPRRVSRDLPHEDGNSHSRLCLALNILGVIFLPSE